MYIGYMPPSGKCSKKSCKLNATSMGHCGVKACPGLGITDHIHTKKGQATMKSKAKKHKVTQRALLEKVIKDVGPDAETADIEAVAKALASMNLKKPGSGAKAGKRHKRSRRVRKSRHLRMKHSSKKRSGRKSRR